MSSFSDALKDLQSRVPETRLAMIMGTDGIPIERVVADGRAESVAAEFTALIRNSLSTVGSAGLGHLAELAVVADGMSLLVVAITPEYFVFSAMAPGALMGRARFALRLAAIRLEGEFR